MKKIDDVFDRMKFIWEEFNIIKLGLGFKEDLRNLISTFNKNEILFRNYVDIKNLYQEITGKNKHSLTDISKDIFGIFKR